MTITISRDAPINRINTTLAWLCRLPQPFRLAAFDFLFGRLSRFYRTVGVKATIIGPHSVTLGLADMCRVRNHVGGIHAVALTLPAEYAAGLVVAQHLPAKTVVVLRSLQLDLHKPVRGSVRATAKLTAEQARALREQAKGQIDVPVCISDAAGEWPVSGCMRMAWRPKN